MPGALPRLSAPIRYPRPTSPGLSVFARTPTGDVYHTYSTYARGLDQLIGTYTLLDLVPKGRNEDREATMSWVRHHDRYEPSTLVLAPR